MATRWQVEKTNVFWFGRPWVSVVKNSELIARVQRYEIDCSRRAQIEQLVEEDFYAGCPDNQDKVSFPREEACVQDLKFWVCNSSWSYCPSCFLLKPEKMRCSFAKRPVTKTVKNCICRKGTYTIPVVSQIPEALRGLSRSDVCTLRPIEIHGCQYRVLQHGYRVKTGILRLRCSPLSVAEKIDRMTDADAKKRCQTAYDFLVNLETSSYRSFLEKRVRWMAEDKHPNVFNFDETMGIECALWPHLYPCKAWCESVISGRENRKSTTVSFQGKILSQIVDYSLDFELLQFHHDRWICKTITGAINSARYLRCSPVRALDMKTFTPGYWHWQHRYLIDAVKQFGFPALFMTISPNEPTFPVAKWLAMEQENLGLGARQMASLETLHIAHVLEQLVRGYLTGSNDARWKIQVLNYRANKDIRNIQTYFYRFEFQRRGTVHMHLLVWLKDLEQIQYDLIRADLPHNRFGYLAMKYQRSNKSVLVQRDEPTSCSSVCGRKVLDLHHPAEAFAINLRAYLATILPTLECAMDVQVTDGHAMILRYVTSYVTKWQDAFTNDALFCNEVTGFQAALRHLQEVEICEPEMVLQMSSVKLAWTSSRTKQYVPPSADRAAQDKTYAKYRNRHAEQEGLTFVQWLRQMHHTPAKPKPYKGGSTLVGIRYCSPFRDQFFFQHLLMNWPHRTLAQLYHPDHDRLPQHVKFFALAMAEMGNLWRNADLVRKEFEQEGHKDHYVSNIVSHVASLCDVVHLFYLSVFPGTTNVQGCEPDVNRFPLNAEQNQVLNRLKGALVARRLHYQQVHCFEENTQADFETDAVVQPFVHDDWQRIVLVTGKPGTGKTQTMLACIEACVKLNKRVLLAAPTGYLASEYRQRLADTVDCDTIHSAFSFPVKEGERPSTNWNLSMYDLIVVDEVSMVPWRIFHHMLNTLEEIAIRPVVLACGDRAQQQPIETQQGRVVQTGNAFERNRLASVSYVHHLICQHRCADPEFKAFLDHIRYWKPSQASLDSFQAERIIARTDPPSDDEIYDALTARGTTTILTVSRGACARVNKVAIERGFVGQTPLAYVRCDDEVEATPLYKNMRVIITQNQNKATGVVNGARAHVQFLHNSSVILKLEGGSIVNTYLVTCLRSDNMRTVVYPFVPSYALTICKAQGQTLPSAVIWFDVLWVPAGSAYVALSRVKTVEHLRFLVRMRREHFTPVSL